MELTTVYLKERHTYWINRLDEKGVFDGNMFKPVTFEIKPFSKTYHALCIHRILKTAQQTIIRFYCQEIDVSPHWVDSLLVHEMIHQYIFQNDIKDSSVHGMVFKQYMKEINELFPNELNIDISSYHEPLSGPGKKVHKLILLRLSDYHCMWCLIESFRYDYFLNKAAKAVEGGILKAFIGCESNDLFFNYYTCCRKTFRGIKMTIPELKVFCKRYNLRLSSSVNYNKTSNKMPKKDLIAEYKHSSRMVECVPNMEEVIAGLKTTRKCWLHYYMADGSVVTKEWNDTRSVITADNILANVVSKTFFRDYRAYIDKVVVSLTKEM